MIYLNYLKFLLFKILLLVCFFYFNSCSYFQKKYIQIEENKFTGEQVYFTDLDNNYKKLKNFSKIWSKIYSKRYKSYHKFLDKKFTIVGSTSISDKYFLVIRDKKNRLYKGKVEIDKLGNIILPSYLLLEKHYKLAKKLISKNIWLNFINDSKIFFSNSNYNFARFNKVKVIGLMKYQDGENYIPLWLKIKNKDHSEALVRYCLTQNNVGFEDHFYLEDPLPKIWGDQMISTIMRNEVVLGMNKNQLRRSIGNPDFVNKTSSRHGLSEQWIYVEKSLRKKTFFQFEYGELIHVNH